MLEIGGWASGPFPLIRHWPKQSRSGLHETKYHPDSIHWKCLQTILESNFGKIAPSHKLRSVANTCWQIQVDICECRKNVDWMLAN